MIHERSMAISVIGEPGAPRRGNHTIPVLTDGEAEAGTFIQTAAIRAPKNRDL